MKRSRLQHPIIRHLNYLWQAMIVYLLFAFFFILPLPLASAVGGAIARTLGPWMGISRRARKHIEFAFPEKSQAEREQILVDMWDNLGRVVGEYAHLDKFKDMKRIRMDGIDHALQAKAEGRPCIVLSGHFANWEVGPLCTWVHGLPLATVYRPPNNPYVDFLIRRLRRSVTPKLLPKGREGARGIVRTLREGNSVGLLVDQKMNEGIPIPFFGADAMTVNVPAQVALMLNAALLPASFVRLKGCQFHLVLHDEIKPHPDLSGEEQVRYIMTRMNEFLEEQIRRHPGQWLWLHRRWGHL